MFEDTVYATHVDIDANPFADIVDLAGLTQARALREFGNYAEIILKSPIRVQLEREMSRREESIQRLAELFNCDPELLKDMARYYTLIKEAFCHTGLIVTNCPLTIKKGFLSLLQLPNDERVDFNYLDRTSKNHPHTGRFNILAFPEFMGSSDCAPLRREFAELFLLTMHDHLHDIFSEQYDPRNAPNSYQHTGNRNPGFVAWNKIPLNIRIENVLAHETFLRQATLAAGCTDTSYLDDVLNKVVSISDKIPQYFTDAHQIRTCQFILYWMARYILPEWDEYEAPLRNAVRSLTSHDIDQLLDKLNTSYRREYPDDFNRFRKLPADGMQLEILSIAHDLGSDVNDFMRRVGPTMRKAPLKPFFCDFTPA